MLICGGGFMKRCLLVTVMLGLALSTLPLSAFAEGKPFVGVGGAVVLPRKSLGRYVKDGGAIIPHGGYMFNDYIGVLAELFAGGGKSRDTSGVPDDPCFGIKPCSDDNTTWWGGLSIGPRAAIPVGDLVEFHGTFQSGIFTALADEALTDTSFGFSTGGGIDFKITQNWSIGGFARYNRLYQRVHGRHDAKYITTGLALSYWFVPAPPPPPPPPPPPAPTPRAAPPVTKKVIPRAVYFDFDKSNIRPDARATLDEAIRILQEEPGQIVICEGHTDSVGTDAYNMRLSLRRANAVRDYLIKGGIAPQNIKVEGFGESRPVATNETAEGRQQNRRVELRLMGN
jgi:outer membrane protein OmpA-like peptidoglycan-associated protein